jgi:hypothetical protein
VITLLIQSKNEEQTTVWFPYIIGMVATAILTTLGSELVKWGVEEVRNKFGSKSKGIV